MNICGFPVSDYSKKELNQFHPLTLSMVGDAWHTLYARTLLLAESPYDNNTLHRLTAEQVCATKQAELAKAVAPLLSEEEQAIFKKGKNAKVGTLPKHADRMSYKLATALEALIGYLFLLGETKRIMELLGFMN